MQWSFREKTTKLLTSRCSHTDIRWKRHGPTKMKKANMFRGRNHFSIPKEETKKEENPTQKLINKNLTNYREQITKEKEKKRISAPEESSRKVCSIQSRPMNASKPNGGNRYKKQSPRGLCPQKPENMEHPMSS